MVRRDRLEAQGQDDDALREIANRFFQGKENAKTAVLRRRIKTGGDIGAALRLAPITEAVFPQYRAYLEREKPHLLV